MLLSAGDMVPADLRILRAKDLFVSQSALTGESEPVEKFARAGDREEKELFALQNICFMGTNVVSGSATAVVLATGTIPTSATWRRPFPASGRRPASTGGQFGQLAPDPLHAGHGPGRLSDQRAEQARLGPGAAVFDLGGDRPDARDAADDRHDEPRARGGEHGASEDQVKRLNSIQNFGAMDILCTDKTGTLTCDEIIIERHLNAQGEEDPHVLECAYLNSFFQTGLKNLIDLAVIDKAAEEHMTYLEHEYWKVDEIPFDFTRRRMSVVLRDRAGRPDDLQGRGRGDPFDLHPLRVRGEVVPLTGEIRSRVLQMAESLNGEGMRVIAVAGKDNPSAEGVFGVADEKDLTLIGYLGLLDPPKRSAKSAIQALGNYGVQVKVLTGDNEAVTRKICAEVGIPSDRLLLGSDLTAWTSRSSEAKRRRPPSLRSSRRSRRRASCTRCRSKDIRSASSATGSTTPMR